MRKTIQFILVAILGLASLSSCERIDAGHVGLHVNYYGTDKGVSDVTEVTGMAFYNPISSTIVEFPTYTQTKDYDPFVITTKDASKFTVDPTLNYFVSHDRASEIYKQYRKPLEDLENGILRNLIYDAYRITANNFSSDSLMGNRGTFELQLQQQLAKTMLESGFTFQQLTSAIQPPESLEAAINAKNKAVQDALAAENKVRTAEANAKIAVAEARGLADAQLVAATAEAESNKKIANSLSPALVEWKRLDRWNGVLPHTMLGNGGNSMLMINPK